MHPDRIDPYPDSDAADRGPAAHDPATGHEAPAPAPPPWLQFAPPPAPGQAPVPVPAPTSAITPPDHIPHDLPPDPFPATAHTAAPAGAVSNGAVPNGAVPNHPVPNHPVPDHPAPIGAGAGTGTVNPAAPQPDPVPVQPMPPTDPGAFTPFPHGAGMAFPEPPPGVPFPPASAMTPVPQQFGTPPPAPPQGFSPNGFEPNGFGPNGFGQSGPALDDVALLRKARRAPARGWRRAVHTLSAGAINPGDSSSELRYQQLLERLRRPVRGDYRIAVLSLKGGVGKTTTTVGLGSTFASLRGDRVIAVDANPDLGTLAQRIPQQTASTVRDLLADGNVYRYSDVRAHTSQAPSRLEVLASERDPAMAEAFSEEEYRGVIGILQRFYNIIITDCGTGLSHSAMNGVLDLANAIILVSSPALDGARSASATLDWLEAHGYSHLVSRAVVVLSSSRSGASTIDVDQLAQHFLTRCRAVQTIPFDDHLSEGADVDLELVGKGTRHAFVELAAIMADDFAPTGHRHPEPLLPQ
ncbi:MinD/ParA family ATP-binding protein [Gordonia desulfuricans]|uniref:MinD/ParA family ATP-binding protein n=1 Tax=Gordonia desulfuricans TaxID=89051 RepID=UPI0009F964DE|nr:MinD/ParA family protein [Gordonia desulfuricans]